jgi:hypothetical protein
MRATSRRLRLLRSCDRLRPRLRNHRDRRLRLHRRRRVQPDGRCRWIHDVAASVDRFVRGGPNYAPRYVRYYSIRHDLSFGHGL